LDTADTAVRLLMTEDPEEAEALAGELDVLNRKRQQLVDEMTLEAVEEIEKNPDKHKYVISLPARAGMWAWSSLSLPGWSKNITGRLWCWGSTKKNKRPRDRREAFKDFICFKRCQSVKNGCPNLADTKWLRE
jgi:hypothetical protein